MQSEVHDHPIRLIPGRTTRSPTANDLVASVRAIPNYFGPAECDRILALGEAAPSIEGRVGQSLQESASIRKSRVTVIYPGPETDWLFEKLEYALGKLNEGYGFELYGFLEGAQIAWYEADAQGQGGHYDWHEDLGPDRYSLRKLSMSVQLTDGADYEGGELEFMASPESAIRSRGSMISFPSFLEHRVTPVTRGIRASLVSWIAGPPFR